MTDDIKPGGKTRILILDDEPIVCKRLKPSFQKAGYEVETFTDSASALSRVEETRFDIVITDLKMEGVDGMRFLTRVKELSPDTGVVVITGFATLDTAKESFRKGAFDFVAKPFKLSDILDTVRRIEDKQRLDKGLRAG
ncbi:MAG: response regulator [Deltaproteobacteria bacterium HGW-Deltaproteobacteria-8]|jgi:DNA-binding NtrC family response regulator|nr:MAG: response regulator [Deltaproteobacteria bacterium HGW-Deltaproteobacteria-8]